MSLFGKFMAVLNLLGIIAVFVLALLVYGKHQAWVYAVYRYDLAMYGLPVTEDDVDDVGQEYKRVLDLGKPTGTTLSALFPSDSADTRPISQVQEVENVKKKIDLKLNAAAADRTLQTQMFASTLLPLAQTNTERENLIAIRNYSVDSANDPQAPLKVLQQQLAEAFKSPPAKFDEVVRAQPVDPKRPFDEAFLKAWTADPNKAFAALFKETLDAVLADLRAKYDAAFEEALKGTRAGKKISQDQRRHAIAHLLFSLEDSLPKTATFDADAFADPAGARVVKIVGVQEANREMNQQAATFARIAKELDFEIDRDRSTFAVQHQQLLSEAQARAQDVGLQEDGLKRLKAKLEAQNALVAQRQKNVADSQAELAARRKYTAEVMAIVRQITDQITQTRIEVRDASVVNQEYEKKIRELEKNR
jgi:hypothetical protein